MGGRVSDRPDLPDRPAPPQPLLQRARTWLEWVGVGRVVGSAVVVLAVLGAAYWLVKPPPATTESKLPFASASSTAGTGASSSVVISAPSSTVVAAVVVHVAGAVLHSGVYTFPPGSRVVDAVQRAGGLAADADPDAVNLAALLADGQRVYVPRIGEPTPPVVDGGVPTTVAGPVDLNRATADELDALPGVGPATAAAIVAYRELHGPFGTVDDLADVRGIGPAKVEALRGLVTV
jgi:competence protein ComEA